MKLTQLVAYIARNGIACAMVVLSLAAGPLVTGPVLAATMEIAFTGMDLVYDGSAIYDAGGSSGHLANPADADPLTTVDFFVDGSLEGSLTSDIFLDVYIPDITGISASAGTVFNVNTPGNAGHFDLLVGTSPLASEFLLVDLSAVNVTYVDVANIVQFTFGAAVSDVFAQNLPFGLLAGEPVTVTFSAQIVPGSRTISGNTVSGFSASGTGQYNAPLVPEPTTCVLAALGLVALAVRRK
jgi:hypothetical protein